jgi:predicted ATPase
VIASLSLANFKCFRSLSLDLGKINVFAGINGAGKSTVIQSILALRQSLKSNSAPDRLQLRGALTDLGTAAEVYCADPNSDFIEITIKESDRPAIEIRSRQSKDQSTDTSVEYFLRLSGPIEAGTTSLLAEPFNYLHAERIGPRKVFQIPSDEHHALCVGKNGENAPYIVASQLRETPVANEFLILESSDAKEYSTIQYQWGLWMARLFPGFEEESEIYNRLDEVRLDLALQRKPETGQDLFVRPTNTGFGLSFVLGVIVAGLAAGPGTILIVENPEAHLHPKAQSNLGEFLARVAAGGTQLFVETHSEHVLNGIRRMIKQTILTPNVVRFFFFNKGPHVLEPSVLPISVSPSGDFSAWPDGFFDQLDKDLSVILT